MKALVELFIINETDLIKIYLLSIKSVFAGTADSDFIKHLQFLDLTIFVFNRVRNYSSLTLFLLFVCISRHRF